MPQRILVLGASGYIGQHLVRTLSQQGHQILAAARHVDRLAKLQLANVSCHKVDLSWPDDLTTQPDSAASFPAQWAWCVNEPSAEALRLAGCRPYRA